MEKESKPSFLDFIKFISFIGLIFLIIFRLKKQVSNLKISDEVEEVTEDVRKETNEVFKDISKRQGEILQYIKDKGELGMNSIKEYFKDVSSRTLRRDLSSLVEKGLIKKNGNTKDSSYKAK